MRCLTPLVLVLLVVTLADASDPSCEVGPPVCVHQGRCNPPCGGKVPCQPFTPKELTPPAQPKGGPQEELSELQETGVFVAPPRTGAVRGATNRLGVEGMSLTFPEVRLRLPTLEFPAFFHSRTQPRMLVDQAQAPYVHTGYQQVRSVAAPRSAAPPEAAPRSVEP